MLKSFFLWYVEKPHTPSCLCTYSHKHTFISLSHGTVSYLLLILYTIIELTYFCSHCHSFDIYIHGGIYTQHFTLPFLDLLHHIVIFTVIQQFICTVVFLQCIVFLFLLLHSRCEKHVKCWTFSVTCLQQVQCSNGKKASEYQLKQLHT